MKLSEKKCVPCEGGIDPMTADEVAKYTQMVHADWQVLKDIKIEREFRFVNFVQTMEFVNKVADIAENEGHHPNMYVGYGFCKIELWTHAIDGLSENDFILASKIDEVL